MLMNTELNNIINKITSLWNNYENNENIQNKLQNIINAIPQQLIQYENQCQERQTKKDQINQSINIFTENFLNNYNFFYIPQSNLFINYDNVKYSIINEDNIQHKLFTDVRNYPDLLENQQKLKTHVIKTIKEKTITNTIPESETIQNVISLFHPFIFTTKRESQYFLTIIGDNILKKNTEFVHIINNKIKPIITLLSEYLNQYLGNSNGISSFKFKYYDQPYEQTRLLNCNKTIYIPHVVNTSIIEDFINLIAVACHYSIRYGSSDNFINEKITDLNIKNHIYFLKNNKPEMIVKDFSNEMLIKTNNKDNIISQKNMIYLWKIYLESKNLPSIMFMTAFKLKINLITTFDSKNENYTNLTSKSLPTASNFIAFWDKNIYYEEDELNELDIDEIYMIFKKYCENNNINIQISETEIISLIEHFFSNFQIINNKCVLNIRCKLLNKQSNIQRFISDIMNDNEFKENEVQFNKLYKIYCKKEKDNVIISNKSYFEKYLKRKYQNATSNNIINFSKI